MEVQGSGAGFAEVAAEMWFLWMACAACPCDRVPLPNSGVSTEAGLVDLLAAVRAELYPALEGVEIGVAPVKELAFFRAWAELDTLAEDDGRLRTYTVQYDPVVLADPPEAGALAAILGHEVGHVEDYVAMDSDALLEFAAWYGTQDPMKSDELAAYERATDEKVLERGCAEALSTMRAWIYAHCTPEQLTEKERNYYTPEQITAWTAANGTCGG